MIVSSLSETARLIGRVFLAYRWIFMSLAVIFILRTFFVDVFRIRTPSMEGEIVVGDVVLISKIHYGPRLPQVLKLPFVEDENPIFRALGFRPYLSAFSLPYWRGPGFSQIARGDILAFNLPVQDRIVPELKTNLVKRCVGLPGDTIQVVEGILSVNKEIMDSVYRNIQHSFNVTSNVVLGEEHFAEFGIKNFSSQAHIKRRRAADTVFNYFMLMSDASAITMRNSKLISAIEPLKERSSFVDLDIYPHVPNIKWNRDNSGPLIVPKKGMEVTINRENYYLYEPILRRFEEVTQISIVDGQYIINAGPPNRYRFKKDYYYVLGDNRHLSTDSRYWGFVPEDHLIGKAIGVIYSRKSKFNWSRTFKRLY